MRNILILGCLIILMTSLGVCDDVKFKHPPAQSDLTPRTKYVETQVGAALPVPGYKKDQDAFVTAIGLMNDKLDIIIDLLGKKK